MLQDDFSDQSGDDLDNIGPGEPKSVVESANGTLVIIVCRGKHLPNRRKLDKQSPYVSLRLGTIAKKTSAHFRAGQTPEWTQEIRFEEDEDDDYNAEKYFNDGDDDGIDEGDDEAAF